MRYLSFFSGIGAFEYILHSVFPEAECLGYSEINPFSIKIYQKHFPSHWNWGDITQINPDTLPVVDLVVGGFPCTNLSSLARIVGDCSGLEGKESGLFYHLFTILQSLQKKNPSLQVILENNASMSIENRDMITQHLQAIFPRIRTTLLNNADYAVQTRRRIFWTTFPVVSFLVIHPQEWKDVLEPVGSSPYTPALTFNCLHPVGTGKTRVAQEVGPGIYRFQETFGGKSRWDIQKKSDTLSEKSRPIVSNANYLIDRRGLEKGLFRFRQFTVLEIERLFGFPDGYTEGVSKTQRKRALGNSIPLFLIRVVVESLSNSFS